MPKIQITVIIPTYNRKETLKKCLAALSGQTCPASGYEVILVDDGSTDGTGDPANPWVSGQYGNVRYFRQEHKGPAAARNLGIRNAAGEIILFTGDDMIAEPGLLAEHAAWHGKNPAESAALLGYVTWTREGEITPFMRWLESGGPQFSYGGLEGKTEADPRRFFYTSNISVKKNFLAANGLFDEEFPYAAYEDAELGLRLAAKGLTLGYNRRAAAFHDHFTSLEAACARMVKVGESSVLLARKTGGGARWPEKTALRRLLSLLKFAVCYPLAKWYERRSVNEGVFRYVLDSCFIKGVELGKKRWK
jgi:glycosyltransferase involved in cell wall biosynthesis